MWSGADGAPEADERALRLFLAGDEAGFEAIVHTHQDRVFRLALALLGRREDARDATQEVFLRAFRGLGRWRFEARLSTWLYRVTLNVCSEARRRRWSESSKAARFALLVLPFVRRHERAPDEAVEVAPLVAWLPPRQREVVVLRGLLELSVEEAAAVLGIPEGTVKSHFSQAKAALRNRLARQESKLAPKEAACR